MIIAKYGIHDGNDPADEAWVEEEANRAAVSYCRAFLAECRKVKPTMGVRRVSSYWLKHAIENSVGCYIPNGAAIYVARELGFEIRPYGINALIGVSRRDVQKLALRLRGGKATVWNDA